MYLYINNSSFMSLKFANPRKIFGVHAAIGNPVNIVQYPKFTIMKPDNNWPKQSTVLYNILNKTICHSP